MITDSLLHLYDLPLERELVPINDGFNNTVYTNGDLIFRVSPSSRRSQLDIMNELAFIKGLWKKGVPVALPVASIRKRMVETIGEHLFVVAFEKALGTSIDITNPVIWNKELFYHWGSLMGKMHSAGKEIKVARPTWTVHQPDILNLFPKISSKPVAEMYSQLLNQLVKFPLTPDLFGLIHNDFHQGNFFVNEGQITVFDFDDSAYHWFAYDLAVSFYHAFWQATSFTPEDNEFSSVFWENFIKGYKQEHTLSAELIQQIPIFLKIREIFLYTLFLEKWDIGNIEDWQEYTLTNLKNNIETGEPYANVNFAEMIDNLSIGKINLK
ncbi:phosphotransferase [Neobacillus niacini]